MRNMFVGLFMMFALLGFVFAASSEVAVDFSVGSVTGEVSKYIPSKNIVGDYLGYIVLAFIVLAFVYFSFKKKGSASNSVPSRKGTVSIKKKKVSRLKK